MMFEEEEEQQLQGCPVCGGHVGLNEGVITTIDCRQCEMIFAGRTRQNMIRLWNQLPRHSIIEKNEEAIEKLSISLRELGSLLASWGRELGYKGSDGEIIAIMRKIKTMTPMEQKFQDRLDEAGEKIRSQKDEIAGLQTVRIKLTNACEKAHEFIRNGKELGFIDIPEPRDPAVKTPEIIEKALKAVGVTVPEINLTEK